MTTLPRHISLTVSHNPHKLDYTSVQGYLERYDFDDEDITPEDRAAAVQNDELWEIRWYPDTPVGQCVVAAATLQRALERANEP